uniref:DEAD/DEAH box helicase n=1 Tax=Nocardioides sp. TaxID=35761 RepID=UPI003561F73C
MTTSDTATFADLGLADGVLAAVQAAGYETPSPIQAATIPPLLAGSDVVGLAQTGTGKTAAFALPILSKLNLSQKSPQALVLAPTRELALQVCEAFERYAAQVPGVKVLPVYGGQGYGIQLSALRRGVHVVVGTPGRIMDHLDRGTLDLTELRFLVLDEADEMLSMGFA